MSTLIRGRGRQVPGCSVRMTESGPMTMRVLASIQRSAVSSSLTGKPTHPAVDAPLETCRKMPEPRAEPDTGTLKLMSAEYW